MRRSVPLPPERWMLTAAHPPARVVAPSTPSAAAALISSAVGSGWPGARMRHGPAITSTPPGLRLGLLLLDQPTGDVLGGDRPVRFEVDRAPARRSRAEVDVAPARGLLLVGHGPIVSWR